MIRLSAAVECFQAELGEKYHEEYGINDDDAARACRAVLLEAETEFIDDWDVFREARTAYVALRYAASAKLRAGYPPSRFPTSVAVVFGENVLDRKFEDLLNRQR